VVNVLLVYPRAPRDELIGWGDLGAIAEPLALEYLAAAARQDGHEVRILDLRLHPGELEPALERFRPDVVGLTGYSMHVLRILAAARTVKAVLPACPVAVGGHHATLLPEDFFEPPIDYVVTGEGVGSFRGILDEVRSRGRTLPLSAPPGVWAHRGGQFVSGGPAHTPDLDAVPPPDRHLTAGDRSSYFIDWMRPIALLRTSVGCPYRCNFCSLWRIMDGRYVTRGLERVVAELASVPEPYVFLVDDEAFVNGKRMTDLARLIRESGVRKKYFAYCRIDTLLREREMLARWREIGLERLFIGIEAVTSDELAGYNKKLTAPQVEAGLQVARDLGIHVFAGFIVNPAYTRKDFKRLIRFIEHNRIDYPSFTILQPLPGTPALRPDFDGVIRRQPNGRPDWDLFDLQSPVTATALPLDEFMAEYRNLFRVFGGKYLQYRDLSRLPTTRPMPVTP
jgi:radical SAM superfamily enzyme YgiQ (UPF0313 family)